MDRAGGAPRSALPLLRGTRVVRGGVEPPTFRFSGAAAALFDLAGPAQAVVGVRREQGSVAVVAVTVAVRSWVAPARSTSRPRIAAFCATAAGFRQWSSLLDRDSDAVGALDGFRAPRTIEQHGARDIRRRAVAQA